MDKIKIREKYQHTSGPWIFHANGNPGDYTILRPDNKWVIGFHQNGEIWRDEEIANAKLIAAAPELLNSLTELLEWANSMAESMDSDSIPFKMFSDAKKAIDKATK